MTRVLRVAATAAVILLVASGCDGLTPPDTATSVEVDTPKLREMKAAAGIEDCAPGPGGGQLPDLTLACLGGGPDVDLADLTGPLLVNLWYSACAPCRDEMPALQRLHESSARSGTGGVAVLGIDVETYPEAAISFAESVGATYPQLADPAGYFFDQDQVPVTQGFPTSILLDAQGAVVGKVSGGFDDYAELEAWVADHLGEQEAS